MLVNPSRQWQKHKNQNRALCVCLLLSAWSHALCVCLCVSWMFGVRNVRWPSRRSGYVIIKQSMEAQHWEGCDSWTWTDGQTATEDLLITSFLQYLLLVRLSVRPPGLFARPVAFHPSAYAAFQPFLLLLAHTYTHNRAHAHTRSLLPWSGNVWMCSFVTSSQRILPLFARSSQGQRGLWCQRDGESPLIVLVWLGAGWASTQWVVTYCSVTLLCDGVAEVQLTCKSTEWKKKKKRGRKHSFTFPLLGACADGWCPRIHADTVCVWGDFYSRFLFICTDVL